MSEDNKNTVYPSPRQPCGQISQNPASILPQKDFPTSVVNTPRTKAEEPPDVSWSAWIVVLGGYCCLFVSFGWSNCIGVFQEYYESHQLAAFSNSTVSWVPSSESFMMFFGSIFVGRIFDSYGPRWILLVGSFFHVFGLMMTSVSKEYYQILLAQGVCSPIGACAIFFVGTSTVSTWFRRRRALALGIVYSGSSLGGVVFPIMVTRLIPKVGFGWTMRICAFLILFMLIIANATIRSRIHQRPKRANIHEFVQPLKEVVFLLVLSSGFLFYLGVFLPFDYVVEGAIMHGMSTSMANYLISILSALSIPGRIIPGYLADRFGVFVVIIIVSYLSAILCLALWIPATSNAATIVFAALYGFSSGGFVSLSPAIVALISNTTELGIRLGTYFAIVSFAALVSNPIGGALLPSAATSPLWKMQLYAGIMMAAGSTMYVITWVYISRKKVSQM